MSLLEKTKVLANVIIQNAKFKRFINIFLDIDIILVLFYFINRKYCLGFGLN